MRTAIGDAANMKQPAKVDNFAQLAKTLAPGYALECCPHQSSLGFACLHRPSACPLTVSTTQKSSAGWGREALLP